MCLDQFRTLGPGSPDSCPSGSAKRHTLKYQMCSRAHITTQELGSHSLLISTTHQVHRFPNLAAQNTGKAARKRETRWQCKEELIKEPNDSRAIWQAVIRPLCLWFTTLKTKRFIFPSTENAPIRFLSLKASRYYHKMPLTFS